MARIRTIKPEFQQSESMGRVSRDARLLFIQLWTFADDEGRARAASRMLASVLFPFDDDVPALIDGWLSELEREKCIRRYSEGGTLYLEIVNWAEHQKIDKPTKSRLPSFSERSRESSRESRESSRDLDEASTPDLVPSTIVPSTYSEAKASGGQAAAAVEVVDTTSARSPAKIVDPDGDLFRRSREIFGEKCGGQISRLKSLYGGDVAKARQFIEAAALKDSPSEYLAAALKRSSARSPPPTNSPVEKRFL